MLFVRRSSVSEPLRVALGWWLEVLQLDIAEAYAWNAPESKPAYLWVDARGVPPRHVFRRYASGFCACAALLGRCAAVLCIDKHCYYTDG